MSKTKAVDAITKTLRRLGPERVKKMDKSATSSMYDDVSELSAAERRELQKQLDKAKEAEKKPKGKRTLEEVEKEYTPAQRRALEKELDSLSRSAMGMAKGGMPVKKAPAKKMMIGGMTKKYNKGGMGTASNCGASVKASGGSRNK